MKTGRIYILPTRFGFMFLLGILLMLIIGSTYQNNLVNLLSFFMLSLFFVAMVQTHNNLKDVRLERVEVEPGHAGGRFLVHVILHNSARDSRYGLEVKIKGLPRSLQATHQKPLLGRSHARMTLTCPAEKRGQKKLENLRVQSIYPLGLFRAWTWFYRETAYYVYPEPLGGQPFRTDAAHWEVNKQHVLGQRDGDDFRGHRKFHEGDSPRHVDWKAHARGRGYLVKEFGEESPETTHLDWYSLEGLDTEARLSQITAWIDDVKKKRMAFVMRIPGFTAAGQGQRHIQQCLEALAVFDPITTFSEGLGGGVEKH